MTPGEFLIILAMAGYAIYQQTRRHQIDGSSRFKLAIIYGIVGLVVGGFNLPRTTLSVVFLVISLVLSLIVGLARGRLTRLWREDSKVYSQGTPLTITLFGLLIVAKFGLGTVAYFLGASDDGGIGEILLMIAVMVAVQAELIWRRAQPLLAATDETASAMPAAVARSASAASDAPHGTDRRIADPAGDGDPGNPVR